MPIGPNGERLPYPEDFGGGVPPELAALLGGAGAPQTEPEAAPASGPDILRQMLQSAAAYRDSEDDDEDLMEIEKVTSLIQGLLAKQAKEQDDMLMGKVTPRALRRATRS